MTIPAASRDDAPDGRPEEEVGHPTSDPCDGRALCPGCERYIWSVIHSCPIPARQEPGQGTRKVTLDDVVGIFGDTAPGEPGQGNGDAEESRNPKIGERVVGWSETGTYVGKLSYHSNAAAEIEQDDGTTVYVHPESVRRPATEAKGQDTGDDRG